MKTSVEYYKLGAEEIYDDVNETNQEVIKSEVEGINLVVFPHVYPSHKFRTTGFVLRNLNWTLPICCANGQNNEFIQPPLNDPQVLQQILPV